VSLEEASRQAVIATAQLAKRQLTWLRADHEIVALPAGDEAVLEQISREFINASS
jgi:tRNA A37 N6-isopentenylltransferase MiaA